MTVEDFILCFKSSTFIKCILSILGSSFVLRLLCLVISICLLDLISFSMILSSCKLVYRRFSINAFSILLHWLDWQLPPLNADSVITNFSILICIFDHLSLFFTSKYLVNPGQFLCGLSSLSTCSGVIKIFSFDIQNT